MEIHSVPCGAFYSSFLALEIKMLPLRGSKSKSPARVVLYTQPFSASLCGALVSLSEGCS